MGYYSDFTMKDFQVEDFSNAQDVYNDAMKSLEEISGYDFYKNGNDYEQIILTDSKWYDFVDDIQRFAKENPIYNFDIERVGEEKGDYELAVVRLDKVTFKTGKVVYDY